MYLILWGQLFEKPDMVADMEGSIKDVKEFITTCPNTEVKRVKHKCYKNDLLYYDKGCDRYIYARQI